MVSIQALAGISKTITRQEAVDEAFIIAELLDYFRWLAEQDTGFQLTAGQIWELYHEGIRLGRVWSEICEDINLPVRDDW